MNALRWIGRQLVAIRTRLLVINIVAVLVPVVGIEWARTYERELLRALEADMTHQAQLMRTFFEKLGLTPLARAADDPRAASVRRALVVAAKRTRMRFRVVDRDGALLLDSHRKGPPEGPEPAVPRFLGDDYHPQRRHPGRTNPGPLRDRREIRAALRGELGTATRIHQRIGRVYLFVALPVMVARRVEGAVCITRSTVPVLQSLHRLRGNLINVLLVALGFTALLSLFLAATISRPLGQLTRTARRIAGGDRSVSLRLGRADEIGQLARSFDALVKQLDARASYIAEFAANLSHEFKTPLTGIRGAAELLADGAADDPAARRRFLENILTDAARLDRLVSGILELSRIEAAPEQRAALDLAELLGDVAEQFAEQTRIEGADTPLPAFGNRAHLRAALCALIENAVQHSPPGAPVRVALHRETDGGTRITVQDEGPGISDANQAKIFERFFSTRRGEGGTGLGLAIARTVVQAHGGRLTVRSAPGAGSTFTLELPAIDPRAA